MNELKIEDLSVGDWVCYTGKRIDGIGPNRKITYIERDTCGLLIGLDYGAFHYSSAKIEDIVPIPITPEILEKNGFVKESEVGYERFEWRENGSVAITLNRDSFSQSETFVLSTFKIGINSWLLKIGHVHELQHAIRLAGIDKEIEV